MNRIYLDHAATSPMHPEVIDKLIRNVMEKYTVILLVFMLLGGKRENY